MTVNKSRILKRAFSLLLLPVILLCFIITLSACGARLNAPSGLNIDPLELSLNWNEVNGAAYYTVRVSGTENNDFLSSKNSYSLVNLKEGSYTITVKAEPAANVDASASAWSAKISFVRDHETGMVFSLTNSNTEFEVTGVGSAKGDIVIPDTYRGLPVTSVADKAFMGSPDVTSVVFGANIREIGSQAFNNCANLTSITLPENLQVIGSNAFQSCGKLATDLVIPDSVTSLGDRAFIYCRSLHSVKIGSGITAIPDGAFNGCNSLTSVEIPSTVTSIGESAFFDCYSLPSINTGANVTEIGASAFGRNDALTSVTFGDKLETIGESAFGECIALTSVTLPASLKTIGVNAFNGSTNLADVQLGGNEEKISSGAFYGTKLWKEDGKAAYLDGWLLGMSYPEDTQSSDRIADEKIADGTIGIADYAYSNCAFSGATLELPEGLKYIGEGAFSGASGLVQVIIGKDVVSLGDYAFDDITTLSTVILGSLNEDYDNTDPDTMLAESSLRDIGDYAFRDCTALTSITMPDSLEHVGTYAFTGSGLWTNATTAVYAGNWLVEFKDLGSQITLNVLDGTAGVADYAFYQNSTLMGVAFPASCKYIGRGAFYQCSVLVQVALPANLTAIEDYTFYSCTNLTLTAIPETVTRIGRSAFYKCALSSASETDGNSLTIPDSVKEIGDYAFYGCYYKDTVQDENGTSTGVTAGVDAVIIGDGVERIGSYAFYNMGALKSVVIGNSVKEIGNRAFYKCEELVDVRFGTSLEKIGERAFYGCSAMDEAALPDSIREIGDYAFYKCTSIKSADLGGAQVIGSHAFFGCTSLENLSIPATVKSIGDQAFRNCAAIYGVVLPSSLTEIGPHAFYGCNNITFYTQSAADESGWNSRWNSSYRPVVYGCTVADEGYLVSFVYSAENIKNVNSASKLTAPFREGYKFEGWATEQGGEVVYSLAETTSAEFGTTLYAVWTLA